MNAIEVRDVRKTYQRYGRHRHFGTLKSAILTGRVTRDLKADDAFEALRGVSFDVAAGQTFGIVGRNGSGKSTMLKLIAGIGRPSSGDVNVHGGCLRSSSWEPGSIRRFPVATMSSSTG